MAPRFTHYESGSLFLFGKEGKEKKNNKKKKKRQILSGRLKVKIIQFIMQFSFPRYPFSIRILQNRSPQVTNLSSETVSLSARISPELSVVTFPDVRNAPEYNFTQWHHLAFKTPILNLYADLNQVRSSQSQPMKNGISKGRTFPPQIRLICFSTSLHL